MATSSCRPSGSGETKLMPVQPHLPAPLAAWLRPFLADLTKPAWRHVLALVAGAILAPGRRTAAATRQVMGLGQLSTFTNHHRVLNRNRRSSRATAKRLLHLRLGTFAPKGPVAIGIDETVERRWGPKIKARGIYRDPVRWPLRQGRRTALDFPPAARADPDRAGTFGALRAKPRPSP